MPLGFGVNIVQKTPWSSMLHAFFRDEVRYKKEYWERYWQAKPGTYLAGGKATRDKDGYWWIQGRIDDALTVAGHRISNAEVESAAVSHPKVAEAAVIGEPDEVKGEKIRCLHHSQGRSPRERGPQGGHIQARQDSPWASGIS